MVESYGEDPEGAVLARQIADAFKGDLLLYLI